MRLDDYHGGDGGLRARLAGLREERAALHHERKALFDQMKSLTDAAEARGQDFTPDESRRYDALEARFDSLSEQYWATDRDIYDGEAEARRTGGNNTNDRGTTMRNPIIDHPPVGLDGSTHRATERTAILDSEQRMTDRAGGIPEEYRGASIGAVLAALISPAARAGLSDVDRRVLSEGVDAAGGFLVPDPLANQVIDLARAKSRVFQAGAKTVPMDSETLSIPRLAAGVTPAWKAENAAVGIGDPVFQRVVLTAKTLPIIVKLSRELFDDITPAGAAAIESDIFQALAAGLDYAALRGDGTSNAPTGVRSQAGVTVTSLGVNGAAPTSWAPIVDAASVIQGANHNPNASIYSARTAKTFGTLVDSTGQPLRKPPLIDGMSDLISNQIPNNLTMGTSNITSEIFTADWSQLLIGVRSSIRFQVLTERYADNLQIGLLAHLRADVALAHPEGFVVTTGVLA